MLRRYFQSIPYRRAFCIPKRQSKSTFTQHDGQLTSHVRTLPTSYRFRNPLTEPGGTCTRRRIDLTCTQHVNTRARHTSAPSPRRHESNEFRTFPLKRVRFKYDLALVVHIQIRWYIYTSTLKRNRLTYFPVSRKRNLFIRGPTASSRILPRLSTVPGEGRRRADALPGYSKPKPNTGINIYFGANGNEWK